MKTPNKQSSKKPAKRPVKKRTKQPTTKKRGRPDIYTEELAERILTAIASQATGLNIICKRNKDFPGITTVMKWLREREDFAKRYACAREDQADLLADETISIAENLPPDPTKGQVAKARLRIDSRKWVAAKLRPKKYGDKTDITSDGKALPASQPIVFLSAENLTDEQLQKYLNNGRTDNEGI
ncbi:terminase small subunit-like protein [Flavitalea antarctica]